jgi:endonuclease-8
MPEGDTVYQAAKRLRAALADTVLTRTDFRVPAFATLDLAGQPVREVLSRGKHLLIRVGEVSIHSHLKMEGAWHVYAHGQRWKRPAFKARAVLENERHVVVGWELGVLEVVPTAQEQTVVGHLGPDLLGPDWDAAVAVANLRGQPERPIAVALLDQRNLAGLGNVYANELSYLRGVLPTRPVGEVDDLERMVDLARRLIDANKDRVQRTTTGNPRGQTSWVYGRDGQPCTRCGTIIHRGELGANDLELRDTFWCPHCQR